MARDGSPKCFRRCRVSSDEMKRCEAMNVSLTGALGTQRSHTELQTSDLARRSGGESGMFSIRGW
jgi:hypothetical protein